MDSTDPRPQKTRRDPRLWIAAGAVLLLIGIFGYGIYALKWDGTATRFMSRVVPYPAAIVDGSVIRWSEYQEDLRFLEEFYEREREEALPDAAFPSEEELKQRVLDRLIKERLAEKLARRYDIAVTSDDVSESYDRTILDQAAIGAPGGKVKAEARAEKTLDDRYGMSSSKFKDEVLRPFLVRRALQKAIRADEELNREKLRKAEEARQAVLDGMDFTEAVSLFSEDPTAVHTEGDRGLLGRGLLPPPVEESAFSMEPGEDSLSGVIESDLGYHVIRVTDVQTRDDHRTHAHVHEILVKPISLDDYLEAQKKRVTIITFVR